MNPVIDRLKTTFKNVTQFAKNLVGQDISDDENAEKWKDIEELQAAMDLVTGFEENLVTNGKQKPKIKTQVKKGNSPRTYEPKTRARGKIEREKER